MRGRIARQMLEKRAPGPRALTLTPAGVEIAFEDQKLFREWKAVRRAMRGDGHLVLDARDLWFIVPLHALSAPDRDALLQEVGARVPIS